MLTYQDALTQILDKVQPLAPEDTPLLDALGLVLSEDVTSACPIPTFANSAMDGYAVRAADTSGADSRHPVRLPVMGEIAAGDAETHTLTPGTALRIMTGAPIPNGADAVAPVEDTEIHGDEVQIKEPVTAGQFIRKIGDDVPSGATVMTQDSLLRAADIGMCAAVGRQTVQAYPRPRVAILSTGDELVEPGQSLRSGQIYNSNSYALAAQVTEAGGRVVQRLLARDTPEALRTAFDACEGADVILSSGGVSVGGYDYVKSVFAEHGSLDFWRVAIRPGKPLAFGTWGNTLFFGLPGNPVSSMVTFELFVRPALHKMASLPDLGRPTVQARLTEDAQHEPGRQSYQRAYVTRDGDAYTVHPVAGQGSHQMLGMVQANALLILPEHVSSISAGEYATVLLLGSLPIV
jgi:molybdopterin molybdotransferase